MERRGFTGELWDAVASVYDEILVHPFLHGLNAGTLDEKQFRFYLLQDALYLREYARALSLLGVRARDESTFELLNEHAAGALAVERSLHQGLLKELGIAQEEAEATEPSPTTLAYASFLLKTAALGEYPEALGAVLPCYWVYWEVGKTLRERGSPNALYQEWIDTYAGEDFGLLVEAVLDLADRTFEGLTDSQRKRVAKAFVVSSRYEWMFWDAAWRLEGWPVGWGRSADPNP